MNVSLTVDLEDPTGRYAPDGRYVLMTRRILDMCDALGGVKATFFAVGKVAEGAPFLVRDIAERGHEIAFHSHAHVPLTEEERLRFFVETREDKDRLEQLFGYRVTGFRAPCYSLTPQTAWALDILAELGFLYSSSIMPTSVSRFGFPGAKTSAFRWANGLVEFPLPVASFAGARVPYLGGIYFYEMPFFIAKHFLSKAKPGEVLWTSIHPYDFDAHEKFAPMPHTPFWMSAVLWEARRRAERKIRRLLALGAAGPLVTRLSEVGQA
ncbi:MAG: polysaccharide deacetylase family protein [Alphaproteobacteria bacterium]|nr:polysaccharide deacetylase family protein [Alphaproteobacteria bacterium]